MADGIKIDLGSALPYAEDKIRAFFGKDSTSLSQAALLKQLHETAVEMTNSVQCIGMHKAVPFDRIYQPTKLRMRSGLDISAAAAFETQNRAARSIAVAQSHTAFSLSVDSFLNSPENATVFAGPGWGKTTFLHSIFRRRIGEAGLYSILITLRRPTAIDDLDEVVRLCTTPTALTRSSKVLLLVDGYDEISLESRKRVSDLLLRFSGARAGRFILSCRDHYSVLGLNTAHVFIDSFDKQDKYRFVKAFLLAFDSKIDPIEMVNELEDRSLSDFLSHPLLLALACIVKTGKNSEQPRSALRLLERALITLQYTWDTDKGIDRQRLTDLDGGDRMQILKRIAFGSRSPFLQSSRTELAARKELDKMQIPRADPILVLKETAQFYGILVQSNDGWEFVHRSIQDYLAAKYWVESGAFAKLHTYEWDTRTAYAACISGDATEVLSKALSSEEGLTCAIEMLMNAPNFDMGPVANALITFYSLKRRAFVIVSDEQGISGGLVENLFRFLSHRFLNYVVERCCVVRHDLSDLIVGSCLVEIRRRRLRLDFSSFLLLEKAFPDKRFQFRLEGEPSVTPEMVRPYRDTESVS